MIRFASCSLLIFLLGAPASAQQGKAEAQKFFRAGQQAFDASQYLVAAQAFEQAYGRLSLPAIAFSTAQAYRLQYFVDKDPRWLKRSVELYREYIAKVEKGGRRADAVANLAELEPILDRMESRGQVESVRAERQTRLMVTAPKTPKARGSINGGKMGALPLSKTGAPGKYKIRVQLDGHFTFEEEREVFEGQFRVVEVALKPRPALLSVKAEDGARVSVDGRVVGDSPLRKPLELTAGKHLVTVARRGRVPFSRELSLGLGESRGVDAGLKTSTQRKVAYWVLGGAGLTLLASGATALGALESNNEARDLLEAAGDNGGLIGEDRVAYEDARSRRNQMRSTSWVFLGAGAAIAASGALLYFMDSAEPERLSATTLAPYASGDGVGLSLGGTY